jgi:hypothetical protein
MTKVEGYHSDMRGRRGKDFFGGSQQLGEAVARKFRSARRGTEGAEAVPQAEGGLHPVLVWPRHFGIEQQQVPRMSSIPIKRTLSLVFDKQSQLM